MDEYNIKTNYNKANNISVRNVTKNQADYTLNIEKKFSADFNIKLQVLEWTYKISRKALKY